MTGSVRTAARSGGLVEMALAAGIALIGTVVVLGSRNSLLLVAAPIGGIALIYAARRPLLATTIMVVVEVTNVSGVLAPRAAIPFFQASMLLGVLAIGFALRDPSTRGRLNIWTTICAAILAFYIATQVVAAIGSVDVGASMAGLYRTVVDCLFLMVVLMLVQLTARPWAVAAAVVVPLAALSVLTVIDEVVYGGTVSFAGFSTVTKASGELVTTLRYGGPLPDSNFWGRHLVMGLPLAAALLTRSLRSHQRLVVLGWTVAVFSQLAGIYLTQSRGTFLAAGISVAVWFAFVERSVKRWSLAYVPLVAAAFAVPGVGNRLEVALHDVLHARATGNVDPSVLGRLGAQQEAWLMFQERPLFGFGPATFPGQVIEFAGRVPIAVREPTDAPHNLYAEFAAESGWLGLIGWAVVILGFLTLVVLRIVQQPHSRDRVLAAAVCAALLAWSAASIALHMAYFRTLAVVLALAGALAPSWPVPAEVIRRFLHGVAVWLVAGIAGLSTFWVYKSMSSSPAVVATQRMTLVPVGPMDGWYAYALDIRSRVELLPTFAVMLQDTRDAAAIGSDPLPGVVSSTAGRGQVSIDADPVRGLLTFTAAADNATEARDAIQLAVGRSDAILSQSIGYQQYSLETVGSMRIAQSQRHSQMAPFIGGSLGGGVAIVTGLVLTSWLLRRRPVEEVAEAPVAEVVP